jgi:hypothetical protein
MGRQPAAFVQSRLPTLGLGLVQVFFETDSLRDIPRQFLGEELPDLLAECLFVGAEAEVHGLPPSGSLARSRAGITD